MRFTICTLFKIFG